MEAETGGVPGNAWELYLGAMEDYRPVSDCDSLRMIIPRRCTFQEVQCMYMER